MPRSEYLPLNTQRQALLLGIIVKVIKGNVLHDEFSFVVKMRTCAAHLSFTIPLLSAITTTFHFGIFLLKTNDSIELTVIKEGYPHPIYGLYLSFEGMTISLSFTRNLHFTWQL
jgi:hypothetical protein